MPKLSKIQSNFNGGEVSQNVYGRVDSERYDTVLATCLNYIPILQGPLVRRAGTKYVTNVKDSTKPPALIPFNYNGTQSYILEFGDRYIRFFANDGQVITSSNQFNVAGVYDQKGTGRIVWNFVGTRPDPGPQAGEFVSASSVVAAGSILELPSPYSQQDVQQIRFAQNQDTLYMAHPGYPTQKLQRMGATYFDLKPVIFQDGPYLPLNSYSSIGDNTGVSLSPNAAGGFIDIKTQANQVVSAANNGTGLIRIGTAVAHGFNTGDHVFVSGVAGTTEANNSSSSISTSFWTAVKISSTTLDLVSSTFTHPMTGSTGSIYPALFQLTSDGWKDQYKAYGQPVGGVTGGGGRVIALYNNGSRYWGTITAVTNANEAVVSMGLGQNLPNSSVITVWQLGTYYQSNFPSTCCFHQNRLLFAGQPSSPQEIDGSYVSQYENFAASGSSLQVTDANAFQFSLLSDETSPIYWMKSVAQGLLAGTFSSEWQISPNTQSPGLTPTNFSAQKLSSFGSASIDALQISNSVIYLQAAQRRLREMNYFVQVGSFRSTNLSELSEHITLPSISQMTVQKEPHPLVWSLRGDGVLLSLSYNRDDVSLKSGFARHILGGQSDSAGSAPVVKDITVANASSALYNELWMTVARSINGSSFVSVEYMTKTLPENGLQEDSYYLDCGATFDNPLAVTAMTNAPSCVVTVPSHGFTASSLVRFYTTFGMNSSSVDVNGVASVNNLLNGNTFTVASTSVNAFKLLDAKGADVSSIGYSAYLGSSVVRKLVTNISGLTWLSNDTVSVLADGGIHPSVVVNSAGSIHLAYPAAKVQIGYPYNSDGKLLRTKEGSAQGTSIGSTRRVNRVAFMLHNVAELSCGPSFTNLLPVEFPRADIQSADAPTVLVDGVFREGFQGTYTYDDAICFRQSAPLSGTIQAIVRFLEENDV